jgi:hypothetical protein
VAQHVRHLQSLSQRLHNSEYCAKWLIMYWGLYTHTVFVTFRTCYVTVVTMKINEGRDTGYGSRSEWVSEWEWEPADPSSHRRGGPISKHVEVWKEQKYVHGFRLNPKPRTTVLTTARRNLLDWTVLLTDGAFDGEFHAYFGFLRKSVSLGWELSFSRRWDVNAM